jgi:hypothetical protein
METQKVNEKIDEFLKIRRQSLYDLEKAIEGLYAMGVRFHTPGEDGLPEISAAQNLLPRYEFTLEDFEWKAIFDDGSEMDQFGEEEHHFGNIDQKKLAKLMYISNFEIDTSNVEKRAIITLDFKNGTFDFLNCGPMEVRGKLTTPCTDEKKLILFKRRRETFTASVEGKTKELLPTGEKITYTRYYLGYETPSRKVVICIYPNDDIGIEELK